jgi:hypothetical protein
VVSCCAVNIPESFKLVVRCSLGLAALFPAEPPRQVRAHNPYVVHSNLPLSFALVGCRTPPDVPLPFGQWSCPFDPMPVGGTCQAICDSAGKAACNHSKAHASVLFKPCLCHCVL